MSYKDSDEWTYWLKLFVVAMIFALIIRKFIFSPIIVDGPSMQPTLFNRDHMIVNKFIYHVKEPDRFDIVIFHATEDKDFIKRVIGLPGEHVEVKANKLYINGELEEQSFLEAHVDTPVTYPIITEDFVLEDLPGHFNEIPEHQVLVLGDNRSDSTDSRIIGLIDMEQIVGKTKLVYWPFERMHVVKE